MGKYIQLEFGEFYHIYNRGNNRELIFIEERNYSYFLSLFEKHLLPFSELYSYCLMPNHFHLLLKIKEKEVALNCVEVINKYNKFSQDGHFLSKKFSNFFNAYSKSMNATYKRRGSLFQERFGRIKIESDEYFTQLVYYIHRNPENHGLCNNFEDYKWSSFKSILSSMPTKLKREELLSWFGGKNEFVKFHFDKQDLKKIEKLIIEG